MSDKPPHHLIPGGLSETRDATPEIQHIADQVKPQFESKDNRNCAMFTAILYRTQVVAGVNYFIKVQVSETEYVHLRVFQSLPHKNEGPCLANFQTGKTKDDPLEYF